MIKEICKKHYKLILTILFSLIAVILYGSLSFHENVWYDEAYQLVLEENTILDIIKFVARDHHAPFYALCLKLVTLIFGISPLVGRMFSLTAIICCFILSFYKIKDLFSLKTSILFATFLLSLPCIYFCSIEIRPYSWSMFLTLASTIYMISIIKINDKKSWILYVLFSILAMYSHNFSLLYIFFSTIVFGIYILIKKRNLMKKYFISCSIFTLIYLPWLSILIKQYKDVANGFWIRKMTLNYYFEQVKLMISENNIIFTTIILSIVIGVIYSIIKKQNKKYNSIIVLSVLLTIMFVYFINEYVVPIIVIKYFVTFIGVILLICSDFISSLKGNILISIIIIALCINSFINYKLEIKLLNEDSLNALKEYFSKQEESLYFIHYSELGLGEFRYYFPEATHILTNEIDSSIYDYGLYGKNVIKLESINELENFNIDTIWTVDLYVNLYARDSRKYFNNWKNEEYYEYINTYLFGRHYLKKISRN